MQCRFRSKRLSQALFVMIKTRRYKNSPFHFQIMSNFVFAKKWKYIDVFIHNVVLHFLYYALRSDLNIKLTRIKLRYILGFLRTKKLNALIVCYVLLRPLATSFNNAILIKMTSFSFFFNSFFQLSVNELERTLFSCKSFFSLT